MLASFPNQNLNTLAEAAGCAERLLELPWIRLFRGWLSLAIVPIAHWGSAARCLCDDVERKHCRLLDARRSWVAFAFFVRGNKRAHLQPNSLIVNPTVETY